MRHISSAFSHNAADCLLLWGPPKKRNSCQTRHWTKEQLLLWWDPCLVGAVGYNKRPSREVLGGDTLRRGVRDGHFCASRGLRSVFGYRRRVGRDFGVGCLRQTKTARKGHGHRLRLGM